MRKNESMNNKIAFALIFFLIINLVVFIIMWIDKVKSKKSNSRRISEGLLFFMAVFFGSIGIYLGMFILRHKNRKWYFVLGVPMIFLQNISFIWTIYYILS